MTYRIVRGAQTFGPYTDAEMLRYIAAGNIAATDLAQAENDPEWLPVGELFPQAAPAVPDPRSEPGGLPRLFPDPPDLPWWIALILGIFTLAAFFVIWDVIQSAWLRRVERRSTAFGLYIAVAILYVCKIPGMWHTIDYNMLGGPITAPFIPHIGLITFLLLMVSRLVFRNELMRHFNQTEPIGLQLNWVLALLFGGLYFQYSFNRINQVKRTLRVSVPEV